MDRRHRLTSSRDFARVMKDGRRATSDGVLVAILRTEEPRRPRVGVTATRAAGGSVLRNRAKRLLREAARATLGSLPEGSDVVFSARPGVAGSSCQDVERSMREALTRAGVAC